MDTGRIVSRSWEITWNHKWLWLLGFLAAIGSGGSSGNGGGGGTSNFSFDSTDQLPPWMQEGPIAEIIEGIGNGDPSVIAPIVGAAAAVIALLCLLSLVFWVLAMIARVGLIDAVAKIDNGEKSDLRSAWRTGTSHFFRILALKIVLFFVPFLLIGGLFVGGIVSVIGAASTDSGPAWATFALLMCGALCLLAFVLFALQFVDAYAFRGIVLREQSVIDAIKHGWRVFRDNIGDSFVLGVIFVVVGLVMGLIIAVVIIPFGFLLWGPATTFFETGVWSAGATATLLVGVIVTTVIGGLLGSVVTTWQSAAFTLAYRQMTGLSAPPIPPTKEKSPEDIGFDDMI